MALISCPDCHNSVSSKAEHCLHCGCPIAKQEYSSKPQVVTIEQTSKEHKRKQVIPGGLTLLGMLLFFLSGWWDSNWVLVGEENHIKELNPIIALAAFICFVTGVVWNVINGAKAWWDHG